MGQILDVNIFALPLLSKRFAALLIAAGEQVIALGSGLSTVYVQLVAFNLLIMQLAFCSSRCLGCLKIDKAKMAARLLLLYMFRTESGLNSSN
jgi:hypothetical protein